MWARLVTADAPQWRTVLQKTPHDLYHLPEYVVVAAAQEGGRPCAFLAEAAGQWLLIPLVIRAIPGPDGGSAGGFDASSPYGYSGALLTSPGEPEAAAFLSQAVPAFVDELHRHGVVAVFLRLHPLLPLPVEPLTAHGCLVAHGETVFVDLTLPSEEIARQTRPRFRTAINKALREGQTAAIDAGWEHYGRFYELYIETMRRVEATDEYFFPWEYFDRLRQSLGDRLHLCLVHIDGEIAAGGLFSEVEGTVQYLFSGTGNEFLAQQPSKLMLDFMRHWAKDRGNRRMHLGAGVGGGRDSLFEFKAGFSKLRAPFYTWRVVVDPAAYAERTACWEARHGATADGLEGFFPAYRKAGR